MKKLLETLLLAICVVCFIVGVHQTFFYGFSYSYSFFMMMLFFFFLYGYMKMKRMEKENVLNNSGNKKNIKK